MMVVPQVVLMCLSTSVRATLRNTGDDGPSGVCSASVRPHCWDTEELTEMDLMLSVWPLLVRVRSSLQDSQAGLTRSTEVSSPVEFGSLDTGRR